MKQAVLFLFLLVSSYYVEAKEIFSSFPEQAERNFVYRSPTERYINYFGWDGIETGLRNQGVTLVNRNLFDRISLREEAGFIGYHGSTQSFRIYQDIIKAVIEEIVGIEVRKDFHFFRIPGDPQYSFENLEQWAPRGYDPNFFICMNYAIYGNHSNFFSSSYCYYTTNSSSSGVDYRQKLVWLFEHLAIDTAKIQSLFDLGDALHLSGGVIFQLFDTSHFDPRKNYYTLSDKQCLNFGNNMSFSSMVAGVGASSFANQIRMLLNNKYTLNPHEALVVMRYDKVDVDVAQGFYTKLKNAVCTLSYDQEKAAQYKTELYNFWGIEDEQNSN